MRIKDMGADDRPVEKMLDKGARALSNSELIALLLRSGTAKMNAMEVARLIVSQADGSLTRLSGMSADALTAMPGIGRMKAAVILAAFELGRRFQAETSWSGKEAVRNAAAVYDIMAPLLKGLGHEELWILFLNRANFLICKELLSSGGSAATIVDQKMVIRRAMEKKASSIIMVHNHPSGNPRPGAEDLKQTERMREALKKMDLSLLDHVIVCDDCFFSFAEEKLSHTSAGKA